MKTTRRFPIRLSVLAVGMALAFLPTAHAEDHGHDHGHGGHAASANEPPVKIRPMPAMANHGLVMALQGSDLVILGRMKMMPGVDETMVKQGRKMFERGKAAVLEVEDADPLVKQTRDLVVAMGNVLKELEKMEAPDASRDAMTMHHMHLALNHALEMAAEGANELSVRHGREMISDARELWKEILEGKAMKEIHARGMSMKMVPMMRTTHILGGAGTKVLEMLGKMTAAQ